MIPNYYLWNEDGTVNEEALKMQLEADQEYIKDVRSRVKILSIFGICLLFYGICFITYLLILKI